MKKRFLQGLIRNLDKKKNGLGGGMVRISDKNGLDKNREIWALSDQGSWCTYRGPTFSPF